MLGHGPISSAPLSGLASSGSTYTLACDAGSYSLTGQDVTFRQFRLTADAGSYTLTGQDVTLTYTAARIIADPGSYALSGQNVGLLVQRKIAADAGSYTFSGQSVVLNVGFSASPGSYTLTGQAATLKVGRKLVCSAGPYSFTGRTLDLFYNESEHFTLNFLVDCLPAEQTESKEYSAKLTVDGTVIPIREFTYRHDQNQLAAQLDVSLARVSDRSLITTSSDITFELGEVHSGVTSWTTLVDTGSVGTTDYTIARQGIGPDDTFTVVTKPFELVNLQKSFANGGVLYDPRNIEVDEDSWPTIPTTDGTTLTPEFVPTYGLTLYQVMESAFVNVGGFDSVETNIPNFNITLAEFKPGNAVVNIVGGIIGMFEPDFSANGNVLYIRDGTSGVPAGMPTPRSVTVSDAQQIGVSLDNSVPVDGILLTYMKDVAAYDDTTDRTEVTESASGSGDGYSETTTTKYYTDYYRDSSPDVPIRTVLTRVNTTVSQMVKTFAQHTVGSNVYVDHSTVFAEIENTDEYFYFNSKGLLTRREKFQAKRLPMPGFDSVVAPTAANPSPQKTSNEFTEQLVNSHEEIETITYKVHPFKPLHLYIADRTITTDGIVYVDSELPQLEKPHAQDSVKVYESGNVKTASVPMWCAINMYSEQGTPLRGGQVRYHILEIDQVTGAVTQNRDEWREGELGIDSRIRESAEVLVGTHTSGIIDTLQAGECPLNIALPLANRILARKQTLTKSVAFQLPYVDVTLKKGTPITAYGRDAENLGVYVIEGLTIQGNRERYSMSLQARQGV